MCQPDLFPHEVFVCLDLRFRCCQLLKLVWPSDYYPLLLLHVGINSTSRGGLESMKHDCTAVGVIQGHRGSSGGLGLAGKGEETRK